MNDIRIALCLYGTMRSPNTCLPSLYDKIIKPWNTDVIVCINKWYDHPDVNDSERIDILRKMGVNIVDEDIRPQPDLYTFFPQSFYDKFIPFAKEREKQYSNPHWCNFLGPLTGCHAGLHMRLNWYKLALLLEDKKHVDNYDYFLITRPDQLYMFPIFDKSLLVEDQIIHYDEKGFPEGRLGGINVDFVIVSRKHVLNWLHNISCVKYFSIDELQDSLLQELNQCVPLLSEGLSDYVTRLAGFTTKRMFINSFVSCDFEKEQTSFNKVKFDGQYYFKYEHDYEPCMRNYQLWNEGLRWIDIGDQIILS